MKLRVGCELSYMCHKSTPMMLMLNTHFPHAKDIVVADLLVTNPPVPISQYRDMFGNLCSRIVAPVGPLALRTTALLNVSGAFETRPSDGWGHPVQPLADDSLLFLLGSRYCETDLLVETVADVRPMRAKTRRLRGGMHYASLSLSPTMRHAQALQRLIC